jgi:hypothetical protein
MENCDKCGKLTHESSLGSPEHLDMFFCHSCIHDPIECCACGEEFDPNDLWNVSLDCDDPALICEGCYDDMCKTNKCVIKGDNLK